MKIIASLTTIPSRIHKIKPVIESLLKQSKPFHKIYINIPYISLKGEIYYIPLFLKNFQSKQPKTIIINRCKDYGPITKILPTLYKENKPNYYILTVDDDVYIHKDISLIFTRKIEQYPDCALSFSGWSIGTFPFLFQKIVNNDKDIEVDWLQGCHGIIYPRKYVDPVELESFLYQQSFRNHDDHIVSCFFEQKNIRKIVIKGYAKNYFKSLTHSKRNAISGDNSISFFIEVFKIVMYLKAKKYYHRNSYVLCSLSFGAILGIITILIIFHNKILGIICIIFMAIFYS